MQIDYKSFGFIDKTGKFVIAPKFKSAQKFSEGLAPVNINGKNAYIDKNGEVVLSLNPRFGLNEFSEGLAAVHIDGQYGYIDKSGKVVIEPKYDLVLPFSEGLASVRTNGKYTYIDKTGKTVIENPQFQAADMFSEGLAYVGIKGKRRFIDKTGQIVIKRDFILARRFSEGFAMVWLPRILSFYPKMCYIDRTGKIVLDNLKFNSIGEFSEGLAAVETLSDGMKILAL